MKVDKKVGFFKLAAKRYTLLTTMKLNQPTRNRHRKLCLTSTAVAEYIPANEGAKEAIWTQELLSDLDFSQIEPTALFCDNEAASSLIKNPAFHQRTKHIGIKYHYVRDASNDIKERKKLFEVKEISTHAQLADSLIKSLPEMKLTDLKKLKTSSNFFLSY